MKFDALSRPLLVSLAALTPLVAAAQEGELTEVIVTAERRAESLQTTPVAVTALGSEDLERLQVGTISDLDVAVPSMTIETNVATNAAVTVSMRGNAEQNAAFLFSEPGVGLYQNGVYRRLSGSNIELADIQRIEVLRGPQGTLFGRNTLAGAINIVTKEPSDTLTGSAQLGYGSYDSVRGKLAISGPISEGLKGSFSVLKQQRNKGWMTNRVDGAKVGENDFLGGLGTLAFGGDAFDATLSLYASKATSDGAYGSPVNVATVKRVFANESDVGSASVTVGGKRIDPYNETKQHGADLIISAPIGSFTLKSTTSYSKLQDDWAVDFTAGQLAAPAPVGPFDAIPGTSGFFRVALSDQSQFSQEFNLTQSTDTLKTILGAFYYHEKSNQNVQDYFAGGFFPGIPANHDLKSDSVAAYAQFNYKFADRWTGVFGGRYTNDKKDFSGRKGNAANVPTNFSSHDSFSRFTGKLGLEFAVDPTTFTYLTFSQGFKAGSYDPFASAEIIAKALKSEKVDSLELGLKKEMLNRTLRLNSALYVTRYKDLVIGTITANGIESNNAGETEIKGLESELTWLATDNLRLFVTLALMDGKWRSLSAAALLTGVSLGDAPPFTFDKQASIGATYDVALASGKLQFGATARHIDDYYQQVAHRNNPLDRVNARNWVDASVSYESEDGRHRVVLNGKNLTSEQGQFSALNFSTFLFNNTASWLPGEPRTWALNYTYSIK